MKVGEGVEPQFRSLLVVGAVVPRVLVAYCCLEGVEGPGSAAMTVLMVVEGVPHLK